MSDNFWFNENAFSNSNQNTNDNTTSQSNDEFLNNIFGQNQVRQQNQQQQQQQPSQQQAVPGNYGSPNPASQNFPQDISPAQLLGQQQNINPQMFMRQQQNQQAQRAPNQQVLDQGEKEQLLRMRQQIRQQQMLHAQQKQQHQQLQQNNVNLINNAANMTPQDQAQASMRLRNMEIHEATSHNLARSQVPTPSQNTPVMSSMPQAQVQQVQSQHSSYNASPINLMSPLVQGNSGQAPQNTQYSNQSQQQPQQVNKPPPTQIAQLKIELFLTTLHDFMNRRGTSISQPPVINNKRINLFFVYLLSQKLGGPQQLMKSLQQQDPQQPNPWSIMCQKLGLYEGTNIQQDIVAKLQIEKEMCNCYVQYLLPYEQYCSTPEGQKDIQQRTLLFQKQLLLRFQQHQQAQSAQQVSQQASKQASQQAQVNQLPSNHAAPQAQPLQHMSTPNNVQSPAINSHTPGILHQSPVLSQAPTPQQRKLSRASNTSNHNSPNLVNSPYLQQQVAAGAVNATQLPQLNTQQAHLQQEHFIQPQIQQRQFQQQQKSGIRNSSASSQNKSPLINQVPTVSQPEIKSEPQAQVTTQENKPNVIKNYVPLRKVIESYGGYDIKSLSTVASEIEITKPVYLFAPELGTINMQALIMGLKNYTGPNSGEVFSALNTLLVTTSDANYAFKIADCLELLDALSSLGLKILNFITRKEKKTEVYEGAEILPTNSNIDHIFSKYVKKDDLVGEDVTYVVDSLTGEVVDDDSDMEIDDMFSLSGTKSSENSPKSSNEEEEVSFYVSDYVTTLLKFKEENKYHFSKIQTKSANDEQIMLIDQLITVTMILRNISFAETNKAIMAGNLIFKNLLFKIVKTIALYQEKFVFHRKRLCLLKDCLLMLDNISFYIELRTLEEAFLSFVLVSAFGPKLEGELIPDASLDTYLYLPFGIDAFTKLLVREPPNRSLMQAILDGSLHINSSSTYSNTIHISNEDRVETKKLISSYLGGNENGNLLTKSFQLLFSVIPFDMTAFELSKFIFTRAPTMAQALFGVKLLVDMIPIEETTSSLNKLSVNWLLNNKEPLLTNLSRVSVALVSETAKFPRGTNENKILTLILLKALITINSLISHAVTVYQSEEENELKEKIKDLGKLSRVIPDQNFALDTFLSPSIDPSLSKEVIRLLGLLRKLT